MANMKEELQVQKDLAVALKIKIGDNAPKKMKIMLKLSKMKRDHYLGY